MASSSVAGFGNEISMVAPQLRQRRRSQSSSLLTGMSWRWSPSLAHMAQLGQVICVDTTHFLSLIPSAQLAKT